MMIENADNMIHYGQDITEKGITRRRDDGKAIIIYAFRPHTEHRRRHAANIMRGI